MIKCETGAANRIHQDIWALIAAAAVVLALLTGQPALAQEDPAPPEGRTYLTIALGLDGHAPTAACLEFESDELCSDEGQCGSWRRTDGGRQTRRQTSFSFEFSLIDDEGSGVEIDGEARVDARGRGNTFAAVARGRAEGQRGVNFGMVGRPIDPVRCLELVNEFNGLLENFSGSGD